MYACLAVTCHLHFWQNDRDFLRATVVTRGWNGYRNKSQHRKSTLEKKILPPFQQGFERATFQSRVRCSNNLTTELSPPPTFNWLKYNYIYIKKKKKNFFTCSGATVTTAKTQPGQSVLVRWDGPVPVTTNKTTTLNTSLNAADANTAYFQFRIRCLGEITVSLDRILPSRWVRCFGCQTFQLFINSYVLSLLRTGTVCWRGWVAVFAWLGAVFSRTPQVEKTQRWLQIRR